MQKLWLVITAFIVAGVNAFGAPQPATPGTLQDYINTGTDGVVNGAARFYDFQVFDFLDPSVTAIAPIAVNVVPFTLNGDPGFQFLFNGAANAGELAGLKFAFNVENATLRGAILSLIQPQATDDGNATALADLTLGAPYDPANGGVSGGLTELIAFHMADLSDPTVAVDFASVSQLGVGAEFVVDGGLTGAARLGGVSLLFRVPDQGSTALSFALGLALLAVVKHLPRQLSRQSNKTY